jgi:hypothetical protein
VCPTCYIHVTYIFAASACVHVGSVAHAGHGEPLHAIVSVGAGKWNYFDVNVSEFKSTTLLTELCGSVLFGARFKDALLDSCSVYVMLQPPVDLTAEVYPMGDGVAIPLPLEYAIGDVVDWEGRDASKPQLRRIRGVLYVFLHVHVCRPRDEVLRK